MSEETIDVYKYLEELEDLIEDGMKIPATNKRMIDEVKALTCIKQIRLELPEWMEQARRIVDDKQTVLLEAQQKYNQLTKEASKQAEEIINQAKIAAAKAVQKHEITKEAHNQANEVLSAARKNAWSIRQGAIEYADNVLIKLEKVLRETSELVHSNRQEMKS